MNFDIFSLRFVSTFLQYFFFMFFRVGEKFHLWKNSYWIEGINTAVFVLNIHNKPFIVFILTPPHLICSAKTAPVIRPK